MNFHKLNMDTWERADIFRHFIDNMRCVMSMTADIDVTNLVKTVHERSLHFYPTMIWAVSAAVNCRQELRMGFDKDGNPGIWDFVSPYYAHFYPEDQRFVKLVTAYHPDFDTFYRQLMLDRERCRTLRGFELRDLPPNTFDLSEDSSGRFTLPLSLNIHHAAADGFHLCRFFSDVEHFIANIR